MIVNQILTKEMNQTVLGQIVGWKLTLIAPSACIEMQNCLSAFCKRYV